MRNGWYSEMLFLSTSLFLSFIEVQENIPQPIRELRSHTSTRSDRATDGVGSMVACIEDRLYIKTNQCNCSSMIIVILPLSKPSATLIY